MKVIKIVIISLFDEYTIILIAYIYKYQGQQIMLQSCEIKLMQLNEI